MSRTKLGKKIVSIAIAMALVTSSGFPAGDSEMPKAHASDSGRTDDGVLAEGAFKSRKDGYDQYLKQYAGAAQPDESYVIHGADYARIEGSEIQVADNLEGTGRKALVTGETGTVEWQVEIGSEGLYHLGVSYYPVKGKGTDIERELLIDGKAPFAEAKNLIFKRVWGNKFSDIQRDRLGNDVRPSQTERPMWMEDVLRDSFGYYAEPYRFYFSKGKHTISFVSVKEPMAIGEIRLFQEEPPSPYEQVKRYDQEQRVPEVKNVEIKLQGEQAAYKSNSTLYPTMDLSGPSAEPHETAKRRVNSIGGDNMWRQPGQWIAWEVEAPEDGLYKIAVKYRQNMVRGIPSSRRLTIDGKVPFQEAERLEFNYSADWQIDELGKDGEPYLFHLTKGKHVIRLETTLGRLSPSIQQIESSVFELNKMYRKILMITSATPDPFRDYRLDKRLPDMIGVFAKESERIAGVAEQLEQIAGERTDRSALLHSVADHLRSLADQPDTIAGRLNDFKVHIGSLGTWMMGVSEQGLEIDYLLIASKETALPEANASWFQRLAYQIGVFFSSFFVKSSDLGGLEDDQGQGGRTVTVWVTTGRDQAQVIRKLIDDHFTPDTGIEVKLQLVQSSVMLPATLAGTGPDVALMVSSSIPVDYALRNAVQDISKFPDFVDVKKRFMDSAFVTYQFNGGVYALPEEQTFPMLFYRKDVLEELHLPVPQTWDDVYAIIPELQKNNLQFGFPILSNGVTTSEAINGTYAMMLFQHGGQLYKDGGKRVDIDSETGVDAFVKWTEFFSLYKTPLEYDFNNRFRTGEMPLGIVPYTNYNALTVSAPEIKGLWDFTAVPGTKQADGTIRREAAGGGSGAIMLKQARNKEDAWAFMKWWTSAATQASYGLELEAVMGPAARYPTANLEALGQLPWSSADRQKLKEQQRWVVGLPEMPGGYFTGRHLENAFKRAVVQGEAPREALERYVDIINNEITLKRKEFHLPY